MFGLPSSIDLSFFNEQQLLQICIGANEAILNFDNRISVMVTSTIACKTLAPDESFKKFENYPDAAGILVRFLHKMVSSVEGQRDGTLTLTFQDNSEITVYDDNPHYEAYTITHGERVIVV